MEERKREAGRPGPDALAVDQPVTCRAYWQIGKQNLNPHTPGKTYNDPPHQPPAIRMPLVPPPPHLSNHARPILNGVREPSFFARLFAPRPARVNCFYCNVDSLLPVEGYETPRKWLCRNCENLNVRDENGEIVDDLPEMHNSSMNKTSSGGGRVSPDLSNRSGKWTSRDIFCQDCQLNQTLVMQMLGNYIPDDKDPDFEYYYNTVEEYRASIEQRYPLMCPSCQRNVEDELRRQNHLTRARVFHQALSSSNPATVRRTPTARAYKVAGWTAGAVCWAGCHTLTMVFYAYGYLWPYRFYPSACTSAPPRFDTRDMMFEESDRWKAEKEGERDWRRWLGEAGWGCQTFLKCLYPAAEHSGAGQCACLMYKMLPWLCVLSMMMLMWDPTWLAVAMNAKRKVMGKEIYMKTQLVVLVLRIVSVFVLTLDWPIHVLGILNVVFLGVTFAGIVYSLSVIRVKEPFYLRLKEVGRPLSFSNDESTFAQSFTQFPTALDDDRIVSRASSLPSSPTPRFATLSNPAAALPQPHVFGSSTSFGGRPMFGNAPSALDYGTSYLSAATAAAAAAAAGEDPDAMMDWAPTTAPAFLAPRPVQQRVFGDPRPATPPNNLGLFRSNSASAFASSASGFGLGTARENYLRHRNTGRGDQVNVDALINGFGGGGMGREEEEERGWELAPQKFFAPEKPTGLEDVFSTNFKIQDEGTLVYTLKLLNQQLHGQGRVAKRVILVASGVRLVAVVLTPFQIVYVVLLTHAFRLLVDYHRCLYRGDETIGRSQVERNRVAARAPGLQDRQEAARRRGRMENRMVTKRHLVNTRVLIGLLITRLLLALINLFLMTLASADLLWTAVAESNWAYAGMVLLDAVSRDGLVVPFVGPFVGRPGGFALDIAVCVWGGWVWKGKWQRPYQ